MIVADYTVQGCLKKAKQNKLTGISKCNNTNLP